MSPWILGSYTSKVLPIWLPKMSWTRPTPIDMLKCTGKSQWGTNSLKTLQANQQCQKQEKWSSLGKNRPYRSKHFNVSMFILNPILSFLKYIWNTSNFLSKSAWNSLFQVQQCTKPSEIIIQNNRKMSEILYQIYLKCNLRMYFIHFCTNHLHLFQYWFMGQYFLSSKKYDSTELTNYPYLVHIE